MANGSDRLAAQRDKETKIIALRIAECHAKLTNNSGNKSAGIASNFANKLRYLELSSIKNVALGLFTGKAFYEVRRNLKKVALPPLRESQCALA
ncbi:conserved hypothetical protein [Ricinus communis]|uniref:Uncharacterized protein n=1 Tax=Ricinus communis TaxID=3988 RepID=B9SQ94_RICCO|nr:conserved hypothetical protein [Ricinus communis]